ncbi:MAG: putative DNA binding domain-containing protein [Magnetococcales bacterium]|nr:putative DNA binding domain-containing protein [Magnetococcales bacterium]
MARIHHPDPFDPWLSQSLPRWREGDDMELKSARGGLPKSLWESYSAMANTQGGVILLGVEDNGDVTGIANPAHLQKTFWDTIHNRGKVSINLLTPEDVKAIPHPAGVVLAIRVPRASRRQRPVFLGQNPLSGTYRRNHEGDYHATEPEVSRMLADRGDEPADGRILEGFGLSDIDPATLRQYRNRLASHKPTHPWLNESDQDLLAKLGGWRRERVTGVEGLTIAGILMFGREETIREAVPSYHVDYRERLSLDPEVRWTDRLTLDGTWHANLFQFYQRVVQRLTSDLKLPFQLEATLFRKGETEVHEAIREALVNTLIHADHLGQGGIVVEKHPDRLEFSNPGALLVSLDQLVRGNVSECRNKALQTMFMLIGTAEKAGSGVDKIFRGWKAQAWTLPTVSEQTQPDRVTWQLPLVTRQDHHPETGSTHSDSDSTHHDDLDSTHSDSDSTHHDDLDSTHNDSDSTHSDNQQDPVLLAIATPARGNPRLPPEQMESIILTLCRGRWLTGRQLAEYLDRHASGLRARFLTPLVKRGVLSLKHPDKPNRADQAYTSNGSA